MTHSTHPGARKSIRSLRPITLRPITIVLLGSVLSMLGFAMSAPSAQGQALPTSTVPWIEDFSEPGDTTDANFLKGSWGVTFPVFGGERLDAEVVNGYDHRTGAQEVVDKLPAVGHIFSNLSYFAHSHYFSLRDNNNVDVAAEIHESLVPSSENEQILFDVLETFKEGDKKIILYISTNYMDRASDEVQAAWQDYYTREFAGDEYLAYRDLIQGFVEVTAEYADGYWLDTTSRLDGDGQVADFVSMIKAADPGASVAANVDKNYFSADGAFRYVDSDGLDDADPVDYQIIRHDPLNLYQDFTHGHVTPLALGAPANSWAYDEFTIPDMIENPVRTFDGKTVVSHGWWPIRERWHSPRVDLVFETEQAYRFVKSLTDAGAAITFANTVDPDIGNAGHMMRDEMLIMQEINDRLLMADVPDFEPYSRPPGAYLVGETLPYTYVRLDTNCTGTVTISDALKIAQFSVGNLTPVNECPLTDPLGQIFVDAADVNNDGRISILDALLVAQCGVELPNVACPA